VLRFHLSSLCILFSLSPSGPYPTLPSLPTTQRSISSPSSFSSLCLFEQIYPLRLFRFFLQPLFGREFLLIDLRLTLRADVKEEPEKQDAKHHNADEYGEEPPTVILLRVMLLGTAPNFVWFFVFIADSSNTFDAPTFTPYLRGRKIIPIQYLDGVFQVEYLYNIRIIRPYALFWYTPSHFVTLTTFLTYLRPRDAIKQFAALKAGYPETGRHQVFLRLAKIIARRFWAHTLRVGSVLVL